MISFPVEHDPENWEPVLVLGSFRQFSNREPPKSRVELTNFLCEGLESKYFLLCGSYDFCGNHSTLLLQYNANMDR